MSETPLPPALRLRAPSRVAGIFVPPGSKSLTNRALLLAGLARGSSTLTGALWAEDTEVMTRCLRAFGVEVVRNDTTLVVRGIGGPLVADGCPEIDTATAGTVARFVTAVLAASPGSARVDGSARMRERPMDTLLDALVAQGAQVRPLGRVGFLPVEIGPAPPGGLAGDRVVLGALASSQFVSALMFAAIFAARTTELVLGQGAPARPYIAMTTEILRTFGIDARGDGDVLTVAPTTPVACDHAIEPDASSASYFLALAAIHGGEARIAGLGSSSLQGDARFGAVLAAMGAQWEQSRDETVVRGTGNLVGCDLDLSDMPDMTLGTAVAAVFARGPTRIRGVGILRHHESDRLAAAATELRKLGARVEELEDGLQIEPPNGGPASGVSIATYKDHRMAMAFSMVGDVTILEPACVAKTFPHYFDELARLGMVASPIEP